LTKIEFENIPPAEAIRYFQQKGYQISFDWQDIWQDEHAASFTVAKASSYDLLAEIRAEVDRALAEGRTLQQFRQDLRPLLQKKGWWGRKDVLNPKTGAVETVELGSAHRLATIYDTNLRQAHAAGRWRQIERTAKRLPYLRYVSVQDERTRQEHRAWHGTVLPVSHKFWNTHYPPNGWRCRCIVQQLSGRQLKAQGLKVSGDPQVRMRKWRNRSTGEAIDVPEGIDPGFAYNSGRAAREFDESTLKPVTIPEDVPDWKSMGRPAVRDVKDRPAAPAVFPSMNDLRERGFGEDAARAEIDKRFRKLMQIPDGRDETFITDPEGVRVVVNRGLLNYLLTKDGQGRETFLPAARATIENPFEIWLTPMRLQSGKVVMRRRYIGLFKEDAKSRGRLVVVDRFGEGWGIWNSFIRDGIDSQRKGYLLYAREGQ
jgi:SPP1 gp7 family putative phage head morphogenesis protein